MSDHTLFVVGPYAAVSLFVLMCTVRYLRWRQRPDRYEAAAEVSRGDGRSLATIVTRWAFAFIAVQHVVAVAAPGGVLLWNQQFRRLLLLEAAGMAAGGLALAGLLTTCVRQLRTSHGWSAQPPADVVAGTLVFMGTASGVALALIYRWASSWSAVTIVPYLRSLLTLQPSTAFVTELPFLIKLHIFAAFALLAVAPSSGIVLVAVPIAARLQRVLALMSPLVARPCRAIAAWSASPVRATYAVLLQSDHEEN